MYIQKLTQALLLKFKDDDTKIDDMREVRLMTKAVDIPENLRRVSIEMRDPTIRDEIIRVVATLAHRPPIWHVTPANDSETAIAAATKLEHWSHATLMRAGDRAGVVHTYRSMVDSCVGDGGGWCKFLFTADTWEERYGLKLQDYLEDVADDDVDEKIKRAKKYVEDTENATRRAGPPFAWIAVDARSVYPVWDGNVLTEVVEISHRDTTATLRTWGVDASDLLSGEQHAGPPLNETEAADRIGSTITLIEHWNATHCFPGETLVSTDAPIRGVTRRWYAGDLIEVTTATGRKLSGTPNHPVLTAGGWVGLGKLTESDRVISHRLAGGFTPCAGNPDGQHVYAPIHEVFALALERGVVHRRPGTVEDFHGDGQDADVDVVTVDGLLLEHIKPTSTEPIGNLLLISANVGESSLARGCDELLGSAALGATTASDMSSIRQRQTLLSGHPLEPQIGSVFNRTQLHAIAPDEVHDGASACSALNGDDRGGQPFLNVEPHWIQAVGGQPAPSNVLPLGHDNPSGLKVGAHGVCGPAGAFSDPAQRPPLFDVELDRVETIRRLPFTGHVYNLQTDSHDYSASGIIAHNCTYELSSGNGGAGRIVKQWEHHYGRVPYFFAPGLWMNHWRDRKVGDGVGESKKWFVDALSWVGTMMFQDMVTQLGRPVGLTRPETALPLIGDNNQPTDVKPMEWVLGEEQELGPGMGYERFPLDSIAPALKDMYGLLTTIKDNLDTPRVQNNIGGGMEGAGFAINQVLTEAKTKHDPFIQSLERCLRDVTEFAWHLTRSVVKEKVWVSYGGKTSGGRPTITKWVGIDEDDLKQVVDLDVEIDPEQPSSKLVETRWLTEKVNAGLLSRDQAIEQAGDNPDEVRRGRLLDELREGPLYKAMQMQELMYEIGRGDSLRKLVEQSAQTGMLLGMPTELVQQLIAQQQAMEQYRQMQQLAGGGMMPGPSQGQGLGAEGNPVMQDPAMLGMTPQGQMAAPIRQNGAVQGAGPGAVIPAQAAGAGIMSLGR